MSLQVRAVDAVVWYDVWVGCDEGEKAKADEVERKTQGW